MKAEHETKLNWKNNFSSEYEYWRIKARESKQKRKEVEEKLEEKVVYPDRDFQNSEARKKNPHRSSRKNKHKKNIEHDEFNMNFSLDSEK